MTVGKRPNGFLTATRMAADSKSGSVFRDFKAKRNVEHA